MITERDLKILKHIEEFGYITLKQAVEIAYNSINYGYDYARRRMNVLKKQGSIKSWRSLILNCNVYYMDDTKRNPSLHKHLSLEYYCKLIDMGAEIDYFKQEVKWLGGKCISDAVCIYRIGNARFHNLVEVNTSNNKIKFGRFEEAVLEYQDRFSTHIIPTIVLIDDAEHKDYGTQLNVIRVNYSLDNITEILI